MQCIFVLDLEEVGNEGSGEKAGKEWESSLKKVMK